MAAAMLSLDAGNLWSNRRNIVTGTDAAALAGARSAIKNNNWTTCDASALNSLLANTPSAETGSKYVCTLVQIGTSGTGYISVADYRPSTVSFGKAVGVGNQSIYSMTAAMVGIPSNAAGLRPPGFCYKDPHFQQWLALQRFLTHSQADPASPPGFTPPTYGYYNNAGTWVLYNQATYDALAGSGPTSPNDAVQYPGYSSGHVVHRILFDPTNTACSVDGSVPGNWGWMSFNEGNVGNSSIVNWITNGYPNSVGVNDCNADGTAGDPCSGKTGDLGGSGSQELQALVDSNQIFFVPLFDNATCPSKNCNGTNAQFNIIGFVGVRLWGFKNSSCANGTLYCTSNNPKNNFFDMEFVNAITQGSCCSHSGFDTGSRAVKICSVDHDPVVLATRCTP
jgi:hypothetical protein